MRKTKDRKEKGKTRERKRTFPRRRIKRNYEWVFLFFFTTVLVNEKDISGGL